MRLLIAALLLVSTALQAQSLTFQAKSAYVVHPQTGTVLAAQNATDEMGPASLTKLMTLYLTFDALKSGQMKLTDALPVSEKAWRMGGSKMFVEVGKTVPVEKLVQGISVVSGNDACVVVAEHLGGTEEQFAHLMNKKAQELGMTSTKFTNASGWPDPAMHTSAKDIATLLTSIYRDFPEYTMYLSQEEFEWNGIKQQNRNGLLRAGVGIDAGKTGHTEESGFHLASTAKQGDERLVVVVMGADSFSAREGESLKAYRTFFPTYHTRTLAMPGKVVVDNVDVYQGTVGKVGLTVAEPLAAYISTAAGEPKITATYKQPLTAPLYKDSPVGEATLTLENGQTFTTALVPVADVAQASFPVRFLQTTLHKLGF
ncbi:MAG: hypothetical protein COY40_00970 [Alphaproteobacteria bacterium CG_4_10_14_0_8_um_filter_53_9]|nr:MAG: hypothetical protein COY40_00970 [Alphaproteobacteria bacterium CG_4_10_14_0_8_um_filter_53_9]